jgi:hypothetical protein
MWFSSSIPSVTAAPSDADLDSTSVKDGKEKRKQKSNVFASTAVPREIPSPDIRVLLNCNGLRGKNGGRGGGGTWGNTDIK